MIRFPGDWVQHFGANLVTAIPPQLGARFRYYERIRPQPSFSAIVERLVASDPLFAVHEVGAVERLVTAEGEYGAWVILDGMRDGRPARRIIAATFLHEFAAALDSIAIMPQHFARTTQLAREFARAMTFQLGSRPRVFFYVPPTGWQALASGATANWYPPDFPNNATNIVVLPAVEHATGLEHAIESGLAELRSGLEVGADGRDPFASSSDRPGVVVRVHGTRAGRTETLHRELAVFVIAGRLYRFRMETASRARLVESSWTLRAVASSFRPLPDPEEVRLGIAFERSTTVFEHWAD